MASLRVPFSHPAAMAVSSKCPAREKHYKVATDPSDLRGRCDNPTVPGRSKRPHLTWIPAAVAACTVTIFAILQAATASSAPQVVNAVLPRGLELNGEVDSSVGMSMT